MNKIIIVKSSPRLQNLHKTLKFKLLYIQNLLLQLFKPKFLLNILNILKLSSNNYSEMQPTTNNIQIFYNIIQIFFKTQFLHFSSGTRDAADPCIKKFVWLKYFSSFVFVSVPLGCAVIKYKLYGRIVFSFPWLSSNAGDRRFTITINYTDKHTIKAFLLSISYTRYGKMVLIPMV